MKPIDERKIIEYITSKNARKINKKIQRLKKKNLINEEMISDTYHTFEDLYFQRCILFATICNQNKNISWKAKKHDDDTMYNDYFIVGIDTPKGSYTYHYHMKYWDYFKVKELDNAPKWDGHTSKDVTRLLNLVDKFNNPLEGIFAQVTDDQLLRENGLLYDENKKYKEVIEKIKTRYIDYYGTTKEVNDNYVLRNVLKEIADILKEVE